jgi:hypothetical protein
MLKKLGIFLLTVGSSVSAGFNPSTLIVSNDSLIPMSSCKSAMDVTSFNRDSSVCDATVMGIYEREVDQFVRITLQDGTVINSTTDQNFYVPFKWVSASALSACDALLTHNGTLIGVKSVEVIEETVKMVSLSVPSTANFLVTQHGIIAHNGPICGGITYFGIKGLSYLGICVGTAAVVGASAGAIAVSAPVAAAAGGVAAVTAPATGMVAAGVSGAALAGGCAVGTTTAVTGGAVVASGIQSAGIIAATAVAVEGAAFSAGVWVTAIPFLP